MGIHLGGKGEALDPGHNDERELRGPEDAGSETDGAHAAPPPPPQVDPAEDPLYIDPNDPLYIPVPLAEESSDDHLVGAVNPLVPEMNDPATDSGDERRSEPPPPPELEEGLAASSTEPVEAEPTVPMALSSAPSAPGAGAEPGSADPGAAGRPNEDRVPVADEAGAGKRRHRKLFAVVAVLLGVALLGIAGIAYAGYDYSKKYEGRILPGAVVAGVDVGGMSPQEALVAVRQAVRPQLHRRVEITWEDRTWTVTPKELGARSNARAVVQAALSASSETSFFEKTRMRILGDQLTFSNDVALSYSRAGTRGFVEGLASNLYREPRDAAIDYSTGWVKISSSRRGREVKVARSVASLRRALQSGSSEAQLSVRTTQPEVTEDAFEKVILVRIGENKAYLYEDGKITHEYLVATGQPAYPTPTGVFEITEKRYMPTWINPAPDGWGSDMPASIPPGISNPLGLRALNWSASGIRFHGTTATYSLGYNASHGCVRMSNDDVIELYDLVDVGTPIVSLESADYKPLIEESSASTPTAENSAN